MELVIDPRFNGPVGSANGGYTCGLVADFLDGTAEVTLRRPPPLGRPLGVERDDRRVVVRDGSRVHLISTGKLDYAEAQDDYVALKSEGKKYLKQQTLASLAASLDPARFLRVHRSFVINLERLERIELYSKNSHVTILADGGLKYLSAPLWEAEDVEQAMEHALWW